MADSARRELREEGALLAAEGGRPESNSPGVAAPRVHGKVHAAVASAAAALLLAAGALAWASGAGAEGPPARVPSGAAFAQLDEAPDLCNSLPYYRIVDVASSNLGGKGPDKDKPEGIFFETIVTHAGLDTPNVTVEVHTAAEHDFAHDMTEGTDIPDDYQPKWTKENGNFNHFARVNIKPGTNITLVVRAKDTATGENITLPAAAMTFFDIDTGKDGKRSVEYVKIAKGYNSYWLTNSTELNVTHDSYGDVIFTATVEGTGDDNPTDPLQLTVQQKNRAVAVDYQNVDHFIFQVGASEGQTARVFAFSVRPALRCANTTLPNGTMLAADDPNSPVTLVRTGGQSGAKGVQPAGLTLGLLVLLALRG